MVRAAGDRPGALNSLLAHGAGANLFVDVAGIAPFFADSPEREAIAWYLRQLGIDHVVFGSDFPLSGGRAPRSSVQLDHTSTVAIEPARAWGRRHQRRAATSFGPGL